MTTKSPSPTWAFNLHDTSKGISRILTEGIQTRVFAGEHAMLSIVSFEPNSVGKVHSHPQEQWGVLLEGECVRVQGHEEIAMKAGDFWHTPGGVPHTIRAGAEGALVLDIFSPPRQDYQRSGDGFGQAHVHAETAE